MFRLALTGSIGMGKSTTARLFADEGCAIWDADAAVHRLYGRDGAAVSALRDAFPRAVTDGQVSRLVLKEIIAENPDALRRIEEIVHPLVAKDREEFLRNPQADIVVLDIPLLFETNGQNQMDAVVCVSVSAEEQEKRVMARGTMTRSQFEQIRAKQIPNAEKCARSDFVVETDTLEHAGEQVKTIVRQIREKLANA